MKNKFSAGFWLITLAVVFALTVPALMMKGMFMDAVLYTSVSRNLAHGIGTFWFPKFSEINVTGSPSFHEQPPLVFGIQSVFFRILGDSIYVERIYVLVCLVITIILIRNSWRIAVRDEYKSVSWLPVLLWIISPICFWSFSNNMHENTMVIFILFAVFSYLKYTKSYRGRWLWLASSGLGIFLASFSKGVPGLFPIAAPIAFFLSGPDRSFRKVWSETFILLLIPAAIYFILWQFPASHDSLHNYVFDRLLFRIRENPTTDSRWFIAYRVPEEFLPSMLLIAAVFFFGQRNKTSKYMFRAGLFFLFIAAAGVLPLMLTKVQKTFYAVPAFPFLALGTSALVAEKLNDILSRLSVRSAPKLFVIGMVFMSGVAIATVLCIGKAKRDAAVLADVYSIGALVPAHSDLGISPSIYKNDWIFQCYVQRLYFITAIPKIDKQYYVTFRTDTLRPDGYSPLNIRLKNYVIWRKTEH